MNLPDLVPAALMVLAMAVNAAHAQVTPPQKANSAAAAPSSAQQAASGPHALLSPTAPATPGALATLPTPPSTPLSTQAAITPTEPAAIAYRQQTTGMVEQTLNSVLITLAMLVVTGAGLLFMRKRLRQKVTLAGVVGPSMRLKEKLRLNPRLTVYVLQYREREILLAQSGDALITLGDPAPAAAAGTERPA